MESIKCKVKNLNTKGLTLIEILLAMGVAVIIGALLVVIMINSAGVFYKQSSKITEGLNTNDALAYLRQSIKQSSAVAATLTQGSAVYTSSSEQIILKISSVDSLGNIIADTYDYFVFYKDQNKLLFKTFPNAASARKAQDQIFSTSLDSLNFQYFNSQAPPLEVAPQSAAKVRISLTLKQKIGANFEQLAATTEANLRND